MFVKSVGIKRKPLNSILEFFFFENVKMGIVIKVENSKADTVFLEGGGR